MFIQDSASRIMSGGHPPGLVYLAVDEPEGDLAQGETDNDSPKTDLHVRSYAERHMRSYADTLYRLRASVECGIGRLKQHRGFATRYDKLAVRYETTVQIASINVWLRDL